MLAFFCFAVARNQTLLGDDGDASQKRVSEQKSHYVPLKRRLKLTYAERTLLAGATTRSSETASLLSGARPSYGATHTGSSVYSAVGRIDSADETETLRRNVERAEALHAHSCADQLCCCACCGSEWEHDLNLNSIFCGGKPIWYFRCAASQ